MPVDEVNAWCVFVQCWAGGVVPVTLIELERFSNISLTLIAKFRLRYMSVQAQHQSSWSIADVGNIFGMIEKCYANHETSSCVRFAFVNLDHISYGGFRCSACLAWQEHQRQSATQGFG